MHAKETKEAQRLRAYIKCGYIDTNHAFGDFNVTENFTRNHALKVYEMLDKYALSIPIYQTMEMETQKACSIISVFCPTI